MRTLIEVGPPRRARNRKGYFVGKGWTVVIKQDGNVAGALEFPTREIARSFCTVAQRWDRLWDQ